MEPDTKTIILRRPVRLGEGEKAAVYESLTLREPLAGELELASRGSQNNITILLNLIHLVAAVPRRVVEKLTQQDLQECSDFLGSFSPPSPPSGETDSPSSPSSTDGDLASSGL